MKYMLFSQFSYEEKRGHPSIEIVTDTTFFGNFNEKILQNLAEFFSFELRRSHGKISH